MGIAHTSDIYIASLIDHLRRPGNRRAVQLVRRGMRIWQLIVAVRQKPRLTWRCISPERSRLTPCRLA